MRALHPIVRSATSISLCFLFVAAGCATQEPTVEAGDPAVFTIPHIAAAQHAYAEEASGDSAIAQGRAKQLSPFVDMQRYFASRSSTWDQSRLRMDDMLDQTQQIESFARVLAQTLDIKAAFGDKTTKPTSNAASPTSDPTALANADAQALSDVLTSTPSDSPFDRVERARSFFTSYVLALLHLYGTDSRVLNVNRFDPVATIAALHDAPAHKGDKAVADAWTAIEAAEQTDYASSGTSLEMLDKAIAQRRATLEARQHDVDAAAQPLAASSGELNRTFGEVVAARAALAKAQDALRAAADQGDEKKQKAQAVVDTAKTVLDEKQSNHDTALKAREGLAGGYSDAVSAATAAAKDLAAARDDREAFVWSNARGKAATAVGSAAFANDKQRRLVLVAVPIHIEPGNIPDQIAGIRLKVADADSKAGQDRDVRVLYVHPARVYDTSDQRMLDRIQRTLSAAVSASVGGKGSADINADSRLRDEERGRYLSRLNKTAGVGAAGLDAKQPSSFGWYFYPSNVVVRKNLFGKYVAKGFLESGTHDCAVWLELDPATTRVSVKATVVTGDLYWGHYEERPELAQTFSLSLPEFSPLEHFTSVQLGGGMPAVMGPTTLTPGATLKR